MIGRDLQEAVTPLVEAFADLGVRYRIGGSVASSVFGMARSTLDVDLVADLRPEHIVRLVQHLETAYYVDDTMIREAIRRRSSFNVVHLASMVKVDVFVLRDQPFDLAAFARHVVDTLDDEPGARAFDLSTPEDTILHKLIWYREGHGISERQWLDVLGVLKVQGPALDREYLDRWAVELGFEELWARAVAEAGDASTSRR